MSKKLILTVGISGSGKSTWAKEQWDKDPTNTIIVSRDTIRYMYGYTEQTIKEYYDRPDLNKLENQVTKYEDNVIRQGLADNKTLIVDATHLRREYLERFKFWNVPVDLKFFDVDLDTAIKRDANRSRVVGKEVIERQYRQYQSLKASLIHSQIDFTTTTITQNSALPTCYIFDIDGTIAKMKDRSPYDWLKVSSDENVGWVSLVAQILYEQVFVIICTGRDEICTEETQSWLNYFYIPFTEFHMRPQGDMRTDWIVKEEMWRDISKRYYINGIFDDRQQVVDRARSLGLKVFQVENHNF